MNLINGGGLPDFFLKQLPAEVRESLSTIPNEAQWQFRVRYQRTRKKLLQAYILWLIYGLHYVYLEKWSTGVWFWFTGGGLGIWWILIESFRIPRLVRSCNEKLALRMLIEMKTSNGR